MEVKLSLHYQFSAGTIYHFPQSYHFDHIMKKELEENFWGFSLGKDPPPPLQPRLLSCLKVLLTNEVAFIYQLLETWVEILFILSLILHHPFCTWKKFFHSGVKKSLQRFFFLLSFFVEEFSICFRKILTKWKLIWVPRHDWKKSSIVFLSIIDLITYNWC